MWSGTPPRIIFNDDTCSLRFVDPPHHENRLDQALAHLRNSQVDCLCWNLYSGDIAYSWPASCCENYFDLAQRHALKNTFRVSRNLMLTLHEQGVDYLPLLVDKARAQGLSFVGSFRMNDAHQKSAPDSYLGSDFWRQHPEYRLWDITDGKTYYNATLDYSFAAVRERKLNAIDEVLQRYDFDGIELDWCRNPYAFPPSEAWAKREILTEFTARVREAARAAAKRRGRHVAVVLRLPFSERKRQEAGMDVQAWLEAGLMDVLVMSDHVNNYNRRLGDWPDRCRRHGVLFYPSIESGPLANAAHNHVVPETVQETVLRQRGAAQNALAQGCDGIYMFNYPCKLFEHERSKEAFEQLSAVLGEMGSLTTLAQGAKQFTFWGELPLQLESLRPPQYHQTVRFTVRDPRVSTTSASAVRLRFRQVAEHNPHAFGNYWQDPKVPVEWVEYQLNGWRIPEAIIERTDMPKGPIPSGFTLRGHQLLDIHVPPGRISAGENELSFHIPRQPQARDPYVYVYELIVDV